MAVGTPPTSSAPPATNSTAPWWAHLLIGGGAIAGSIAMYALGNATIGDAGFVAGLAFLGVGSGVAATS
ncbi:MAG: hypothetical protein L3K23_10820 [Thermoplasmata archaeon]|nr:hypothetical protein [Thermoplasmata archaeon]